MSTPIRVGVIWGSLRKESWNKKLAMAVSCHMASDDSVTIDPIDLSELDLPMFSEDLEADGLPESVLELKRRMIACDALLIASPEYNGAPSGALKNAIDWASRPNEGESMLACFSGTTVGLLAASPGALGGIRGLRMVRTILSSIRCLVIPQEFALSKSHEAFDDEGSLKDEKTRSMANAVGDEVIRVARALKNA